MDGFKIYGRVTIVADEGETLSSEHEATWDVPGYLTGHM